MRESSWRITCSIRLTFFQMPWHCIHSWNLWSILFILLKVIQLMGIIHLCMKTNFYTAQGTLKGHRQLAQKNAQGFSRLLLRVMESETGSLLCLIEFKILGLLLSLSFTRRSVSWVSVREYWANYLRIIAFHCEKYFLMPFRFLVATQKCLIDRKHQLGKRSVCLKYSKIIHPPSKMFA